MRKCVELSVGTSIPFKWLDDTPGGENLGRAEFGIVINFGKKNVSGFYVFFLQQHVNKYYHWEGGDIDFTIGSYDNLDDPKVWMVHKSDDPKGTCFHIYAPDYSKYLYIDYHGVRFMKTRLGA